jgi:putative DNA primase/helicase
MPSPDYPSNYPRAKAGTALHKIQHALFEHGSKYSGNGDDWTCPSHHDTSASLGVSKSTRSKNAGALVTCSAGCDTRDVMSALGMSMKDLYDNAGVMDVRTVYTYESADSKPVLEVTRIDYPSTGRKDFRQKGAGVYAGVSVKSIPPLIYGLPEVQAFVRSELNSTDNDLDPFDPAGTLFIVEGEKSAQAIFDKGYVATTNSMGGGKWTDEHSKLLLVQNPGNSIAPAFPRFITVVADLDAKGFSHALGVVASIRAICGSSGAGGPRVRVVRAVTSGRSDDVVDHFEAGGSLSTLCKLSRAEMQEFINAEKAKTESERNEDVGGNRKSVGVDDGSASDGNNSDDSSLSGSNSGNKDNSVSRDSYSWSNSNFWPSNKEPHKVAQKLIAEKFTTELSTGNSTGNSESKSTGNSESKSLFRTLQFWRGDFYRWDGHGYSEVEPTEILQIMYKTLEGKKSLGAATKEHPSGVPTPWQMRKSTAADIEQGIKIESLIRMNVQPGTFISSGQFARDLIPFSNGNLDLTSRTLSAPTPDLFNLMALPFEYDDREETRKDIREWKIFLKKLWPDDPSAIAALQEWFGYVISGDTHMQKAALMIGPPRSGKGTIAKVLQELLGKDNYVGPTLSSLASDFGMSPLIGKSLAVVGDARFTGKNMSEVVERLLSITGEDVQTVNRKNRDYWSGSLSVRFMIISNEMPNLAESSGALMNRMVVWTMKESWLNREDEELGNRVMRELPGIMLWALRGLDRLRLRGHFTTVESSRETVKELMDISSPITAFMSDCVKLSSNANAYITKEELYAEYRQWCESQGQTFVEKQVIFGRNLRAAFPNLKSGKSRVNGALVNTYTGLEIKQRKIQVTFGKS